MLFCCQGRAYRLLPPVFDDLPPEELAALEEGLSEELREGGAAMAAYARLQFEDLPPAQRQAIVSALLRYCELDTLAMVMPATMAAGPEAMREKVGAGGTAIHGGIVSMWMAFVVPHCSIHAGHFMSPAPTSAIQFEFGLLSPFSE